MTLDLILIKVVACIVIVLGLSIVAERVSTRIAGVLSGYPLGGAIILFFIGYEIGPDFAARSALYSIAGFGGILFFLGAWYLVMGRVTRGQVVMSMLAANVAFFTYAALLSGFEFTVLTASGLTMALILASSWAFRKIPDAKITRSVKLGPRVILIRATMAAGTIVAITGSAQFVGPEWAGLFTGFPAAVFPLLVILHVTYGPPPVQTIIRNFPFGLVSLVLYSACVTWMYPAWGIGLGTLGALAVATLYLMVFVIGREKLQQVRSA